MKHTFNRNRLCGVFLFAVGLLYLIMTLALDKPITLSDPGSELFPLVACGGLMICAVIIFFQGRPAKAFLSQEGWGKLLLVAGMLIVYVLALKYLGFLIATPLILFGTASMFGREKQIKPLFRILYAVVVTLVLYVVFVKVLNTMLPKGILYF